MAYPPRYSAQQGTLLHLAICLMQGLGLVGIPLCFAHFQRDFGVVWIGAPKSMVNMIKVAAPNYTPLAVVIKVYAFSDWEEQHLHRLTIISR